MLKELGNTAKEIVAKSLEKYLADGWMYVFQNRLLGHEEMFNSPSPGGKSFLMKLKL